MPSLSSFRPNGFGYAVALLVSLGILLLVVGGVSSYALLSFVAALFCLSWAMRRTRGERENPHDSSAESDDSKQREKEMRAEAGGYGGNGGGV